MIRIDSAKLTADVKAIRKATGEMRDEFVGEDVMEGLAEMAATIVHARTSRGVDADGAAFQPYSSEYAKRRLKKGRGLVPDLTWSGRMLGNMTGKFLAPRKGAVVFTRSEEANKAAGNSRRRDFFDVRLPRELAAIGSVLEAKVQEIVKRMGLT